MEVEEGGFLSEVLRSVLSLAVHHCCCGVHSSTAAVAARSRKIRT